MFFCRLEALLSFQYCTLETSRFCLLKYSQKKRNLVVNMSMEAEGSGEDIVDWEDLVRAVVNCRECSYDM
jgi:hypothetical protein